jgi:hypothetical protein
LSLEIEKRYVGHSLEGQYPTCAFGVQTK